MTADLAEELGVPLNAHTTEQVAELRQQLPNFASVTNPLDYNTSLWGHEDLLTKCFSTVMRGDYEAGMLILDYAVDGEASKLACDASVNAIIAACNAFGKMPIVTATLPELLPERVRKMMALHRAAPMQGLPEAMRAFAAAARFAGKRKTLKGGFSSLTMPATPAIDGDTRIVSEHEAKQRLAAFGLQVPAARVVPPAQAAAAAAALGFPVVVKVAEPVIAHKTEAGAVAVNLRTSDEVEAAVARMQRSVAEYQPGLVIESVLVEEMVCDVVAELIVGIKRDPQFGLALVVGAGGILVEMVEDSVLLLLPTDRETVRTSIEGLRIARILGGYRGRRAGDIDSVVESIMAVAAYAEAHRDDLVELDVNPLMVLPRGAVAVDALIVQSDK
jgi:acyl-CoA synthetase (NDP forming)